MMPTITDIPKTPAATSSPKPLPHATYIVRHQKRALLTLGSGDDSQLMDVPAALLDLAASGQSTPDSHLVENGLCPRDAAGELQALLVDYLAVAERHQAIPMTVFAMTPELHAHAA